MPLYNFVCAEGHPFERMVPLADFEADQFCPCGSSAHRVISSPRIVKDYPGYSCPVSGKWIEGRTAHRENLKQTGCRVLEPGETEGSVGVKKAQQADFESSVDLSVEKFIDNLPSDKKERLANELASGLDVSVERK